jgi:hypothetical protein
MVLTALLLRLETAMMSIMADGYSHDATVMLCSRPSQLFQIQAFHSTYLFFLLLPGHQPTTSTATTSSIRAMRRSYCCHTAIIVFATAATTPLLDSGLWHLHHSSVFV